MLERQGLELGEMNTNHVNERIELQRLQAKTAAALTARHQREYLLFKARQSKVTGPVREAAIEGQPLGGRK